MKKWKELSLFGKVGTTMIIMLVIYFVIELSKPYCENGTLVGNKCLSCPEGYTLDVENGKCHLNINANDNESNSKVKNETEETTKSKSKEEIIADYKENCQEYNYKDIYRYAEQYDGKYAKFYGRVVQVSYNNDGLTQILRVNVTNNGYDYYDDTIYVFYYPFKDAPRILEDDMVTVYGTLNGLETYNTILGAEVTIPKILSTYIEIETS